MRTIYKILNLEYPYFITSTTINWISIFASEKYFRILFDNLVFYQNKHQIDIIAYVIMDNHFHIICKSKTLEKAIQSLKSYTAKKLIHELTIDNKTHLLEKFREKKLAHKIESEYQIWQEGYHPQEMTNRLILNQKIEYIHNNPVKRGLVLKPEDWKYSSARYYLTGEQSELVLLPITSFYFGSDSGYNKFFPKLGLGKEKCEIFTACNSGKKQPFIFHFFLRITILLCRLTSLRYPCFNFRFKINKRSAYASCKIVILP